jgi:hypothetical protein
MVRAALHERIAMLMRMVVAVTLVLVAGACEPTLGIGLPGERALEDGAANGLTNAKSFEVKGSYSTGGGVAWTIDLQSTPSGQHVTAGSGGVSVEAILLGQVAYFRGQTFLASHLGTDPLSQNLVKVAGNAWWIGQPGFIPPMKEFTDGATFRATFLGSANTQRSDHQSVDGQPAVELSGTRADVFIAATPPHHLLRVHLKKGIVVDSLSDADLHYSNFNAVTSITTPKDVIDFSNLSTLPPVYTVISVDASGCGVPCTVAANLKNLGGATGAAGTSVVTFTLAAAVSGTELGNCQAAVVPDVGFNATTTVSCTIVVSTQPENGAVVTASVNNPGRG